MAGNKVLEQLDLWSNITVFFSVSADGNKHIMSDHYLCTSKDFISQYTFKFTTSLHLYITFFLTLKM